FRFAPTEDILVASFGKNEPNGTTRYVTIFNYLTQAIVSQTQVSGPIGIYSYALLPSPLWLTQGTQYLLELFQGATDGYYFQSSSQVGQHLVYYDMRYCNSCTQNTFPTMVLTNFHYGLPDFLYYTKQNVTPAPTYLLNSAYQPATVFAGTDTAFCAGSPVQIGSTAVSGYPPFTYLWTPSTDLSYDTIPSPFASPLSTTTYVEIATDSFGCAVSDSVTITIFPLPVASLAISPDTFCLNDSPFTLTGGLPSGGTYSGPGVSAGMFDPNAAGVGTHAIDYSFTDSSGCSNNSVDSVVVDICTSVESVNAENYFSVYPNPANGFLQIYFKNENALKQISLFNSFGALVFQKESNLSEEKINLKNCSSGIYLLQIQSNGKTLREKIIKE
ncbi:MAG: T9SS type A sorting domain-containing protein, partial [Bacteroidia bacterium]|nr:T9SS type A sorting domain-containing protein [Bacteroidia bacterium]